MKKLILLLFLASTVLHLSAQLITVSEEIFLGNDISYDILGEMGHHILLFRDSKTKFEVQAFNSQMRESWSKEITLEKRYPKVLGIITSKKDFSLIYSHKEKGNTIIRVHKYDPAANLLDSSIVINLGFLFFTPRFQVIRSEDRSKILLYYTETQETIHSYAIDVATQSLLWQNTLRPKDFLFNRDFVQTVINNEGAMDIILFRDNFRSKRKEHRYQIYSYDGIGEPTLIEVPMQDCITYDVSFKYDNLNKQVVAAGLYAKENSERAAGVFYFNIQPKSKKKPLVTFNKFDELFLKNLLTKSYKAGKGIKDSSVRDIIIRRDGGVLLIMERNHKFQRHTGTTARASFNQNTDRLMVDFYFDEVFILSIHPTGAIHWETILHKKQYSQDDGGIYSSFFLFETAGQLRFLFNDEINYENTVSEYIINGLGNYDRKSLFSTVNLDLRLRFRAALQIASNSVIIPSEKRNHLKLVKLEY